MNQEAHFEAPIVEVFILHKTSEGTIIAKGGAALRLGPYCTMSSKLYKDIYRTKEVPENHSMEVVLYDMEGDIQTISLLFIITDLESMNGCHIILGSSIIKHPRCHSINKNFLMLKKKNKIARIPVVWKQWFTKDFPLKFRKDTPPLKGFYSMNY